MASIHRFTSRIAVVGIAIVAFGCTGVPIAEVRESLSKAKPCCSTLENIKYATLIAGQRHKFEITTASPALQTSEGLAYFAAFRLPKGVSSLEVQAQNTPFLSKSTYPDPLILVLNSKHERIAELTNLPLNPGHHVIVRGLFEYHYTATIPIPAESEYVLVFARPDSSRVQSATADNGKLWPVPTAAVGTIALISK